MIEQVPREVSQNPNGGAIYGNEGSCSSKTPPLPHKLKISPADNLSAGRVTGNSETLMEK